MASKICLLAVWFVPCSAVALSALLTARVERDTGGGRLLQALPTLQAK